MEQEDVPEEECYFDKLYRDRRWGLLVIHSVLRLILNVLAAGMIAKGYGDRNTWDKIVGVFVVLGTIAWAVRQQLAKERNDQT